jgi:hypothetical protein
VRSVNPGEARNLKLTPASASVLPDETLVFRRRRVHHRVDDRPDGGVILHVFYGEKVVLFEVIEAIAFARHLITKDRFVASEACSWSDVAPHAWEDVRELLDMLLAERVVERQGASTDADEAGGDSLLRRATVGVSTPTLAWTTVAEACRFISRAHGVTLEPAFLETAFGASGLSNIARDVEGRQIGENTVALLDPLLCEPVPTEWKRCPYPGSRFEDPRPMNVSGLKQMTAEFGMTLAAMEALRRRFVARHGKRRLGLGDLHVLARVAASLPSWLLCRPNDPVANGAIPTWVASLQKLLGGINMPIAYVLLESGGGRHDATMTAAELTRVTEETGLFMTAAGVCSGTPKMVDRSIEAFVEGSDQSDDELLVRTLGDPEAAIDYGLHASLADLTRWACRARMRATTEAAVIGGAESSDRLARLRELLERTTDGPAAAPRELEFVLTQRRAIAALGQRFGRPVDPGAPPPRPSPEHHEPERARLRAALDDVVWLERQTLILLEGHQGDINTLLGRPTHGRLTRAQFALGERRQHVKLWSAALAEALGVDPDALARETQ